MHRHGHAHCYGSCTGAQYTFLHFFFPLVTVLVVKGAHGVWLTGHLQSLFVIVLAAVCQLIITYVDILVTKRLAILYIRNSCVQFGYTSIVLHAP